MRETQVRSLGQEDPLEKEMATHSSIHARKIPWTEEPGGLQSMGSLAKSWTWQLLQLQLQWLYNIQLKTRRGVLFLPPFWCLCQKLSLSPLYFNKILLHSSSEWSSLISGPGLNSSPLEAKNPGVLSFSHCWEPAHEIPPMTRSWGGDLISKAIQDFREFEKLPRCSP